MVEHVGVVHRLVVALGQDELEMGPGDARERRQVRFRGISGSGGFLKKGQNSSFFHRQLESFTLTFDLKYFSTARLYLSMIEVIVSKPL